MADRVRSRQFVILMVVALLGVASGVVLQQRLTFLDPIQVPAAQPVPVPVRSAGGNDLFAYRPDGFAPVSQEFGLPHGDLVFLSGFWGPLPRPPARGGSRFRQDLRRLLAEDFERKRSSLEARLPQLSSDRELLLHYLVLRTNGSIPTYSLQRKYGSDIDRALYSLKGSCLDYALRLMFVIELFGFDARALSFYTPALPGHVVVQTHDPELGKAYLLDANNNLVVSIEARSGSFISDWSAMTEVDRSAVLADSRRTVFHPKIEYYYEPSTFPDAALITNFNSRNRQFQASFRSQVEQALVKEAAILAASLNPRGKSSDAVLAPFKISAWKKHLGIFDRPRLAKMMGYTRRLLREPQRPGGGSRGLVPSVR